jgi:predicted enzyme related to lactoylglutathione lyase
MAQAVSRGRFVWHVLPTNDPKAAIKFYTRLIGWKTQAWDKDPSYTLLLADSGPVGGIMPPPAEAKAAGAAPQWLSYISTPDVKATVDAAVRLGAKVYKPVTSIADVGQFAVLADPQGAVFATITPMSSESPKQLSDAPQLGEFSWHELATTDQVAAFGFYQELFGWEKTEAMDMGPVGVYQIFGFGGKGMGGIYNKPTEMAAPPNWLPYAVVPDSKKVAEAVPAAGGKVLNGPMEVPGGGLIVMCLDPQGVPFATHSIAAATARPREGATAGQR